MPRMALHVASGTGIYAPHVPKVIRFVKYGCTNRPFFHIVVMERFRKHNKPPIEQLGSYDPFENVHGQKLAAFNFERIQYWLGKGNVAISQPIQELLGLAGFLPIHPRTYMAGWRARRAADLAEANKVEDDAEKVATEST